MKRLSKILVAVAALCLLVGALALAISANSGIDGKFVVKGKGYETWDEAVAASANTHTIYLNEDWTLDKGLTLSGADKNLKINLNGKTVSVKDGSMLFNVHTNAKLTIEGEGTINNAGAVAIGGSSYGTVTVNATGKGIVINNSATSGDVNTFRFTTYSTLNVSGKIVVNTNGKTSNRAIFNVADSSRKTVNLNITDADILFATPTVAGAPAGKVIYSQFSNVKIESSRLEGVYCYVIYAATTGTVDLSGYIIDKDPGSAVSYGWDPAKLGEIKDISITIGENYTVNNSVIASTLAEGYKGNISGSMMLFTGPTKADFTNCEIYGHYRAIYGKQANDSWNNIATKKTDASQLTFVDCHIRPCDGGTIPYLVCYGPNARFFGGSISGVTNLANCQPHYIELNNGQWLGVYVDNVLGPSKLNNNTVITTAWQNTTNYNPASTIVGTLPKPVSLTVGGKEVSFTTGYFSDEAKYDAYFAGLDADSWENYIVQKSDANVEGGSFIKDGASAAVGTNPFGTAYTINTDKGTSSYVLGTNKRGEFNGYVKHYMAANSGSQSSSSRYQQIVTGSASFAKTEAFVWEWDVSTDDAQFIQVSFATQAREKTPRFDKSGNYLGLSSMQYRNPTGIWIRTTNKLEFNGKSVDLSTAKGDWTRITVVYDIVRGELTSIDVPAYTDVNTPAADGSTVKKNAYKLSDSKIHVYVDGILLASADFFPTAWGYNGYVIEGYEDNYYFDQIRIAPSSASANGSYCVDNVRTSAYPIGAGVDLGIYNEDGSIKTDINGLDHFLVMPDNMATATVAPVAVVDGVEYFVEADAIAAIREGSSVKLFKDIESAIKADVAFKLYPNGFKFGGFVSATHKPVDYVSGMGFYKLVPASESELYTIKYEFNGTVKSQTAAIGTLIPKMEESFPSKIEGFDIIDVSSWTIPVTSLNDYFLNSNEIVAVAGTLTRKAPVLLDGVACVSLEDAIKKANNSTVVLYENVTVDNQIYIDGIVVTLDLNGKTITAGENASSVFNVRKGSNFTITGKGTVNNVKTFISASNLGAKNSSTVNVEADGATDGIVINHRVMANDTDNVDTFRFHDGSTLNVSGFVTVNAYNGIRTVFHVYSGSGTVGAKALNINKAKVYVPLLTKDFGDETTLKTPGYSKVIYATDNIDINVIDSELRAEYGQIFNLTGGSKIKSVASYWSNNNWTDSAAKGVKYDAFTIRLNVKDSTLFSDYSNFSMKFTASGHNPGASIMQVQGKVDAKFDNCVIYSDFRAITSDAAFTATNINQHQILFFNCNVFDAPGNNTGAPFFVYGCNYKIIGGTWHNANAISNGAKYYLPLVDADGNPTGQWVGGYMDGTLVNAARTFLTSGVTGNWVDSTYTENDSLINCSVARIIDGNSYTFNAAYYSDKQAFVSAFEPYELFGAYANTGNETPKPFPNFSVGNVSGTVTKDGGYIKHYFEGASGSGAKYNNLDGNNVATWNYGNLAAYVWEFDISTDNGWFAKTSMNVEGREKVPVFDAQGNYLGLNGTQYRARGIIDINGDVITVNGKSTRLSITKGEWTRISIVVNIVQGEERTETVPAYVKDGSSFVVDGEKTANIPVVDITKSTISVYVDGILLNSFNQIDTTQYFNGAMAKGYADTGYIDDIRIYTQATKESSICYDNILFMPIYRSSELDLGFDENGNAPESIIGNPYFLSMPESNATAPIISVDGVEFTDLQTALAAIKDGSFVELLADVDEALEINSKDVKLKTNGKSFRGYISSTCKFVDYTAARGASYSVSADADEIVIIEYPEVNGISGSQTAVIGTLLNPPKEFDSLTRFLNEEAKEYHTLLGWTLAEGEDVQIVTAGGTAIPVIDVVKAVVVYWTTEDGNTILDTDFYFPGSATVLDKFDGVDLSVDHSYDYYGYGRSGWTGIEEATAGLATAGEYTIKAVMGKVAPDTFPGLKYNLMLCSNYVMNFYVPQGIEGISAPVLSLNVDGTALLPQFEAGTIDGESHDVFGYMLGIADTEIKTFYLVYTIGEDKLAFPIYVGVPTYAAEVMKQYAEDESAKGEAAKTLVVNMANYATKVFALNGGVDVEASGAKIYYEILAQYGEEYLGYYESLTNDRFATGGDLYAKHQVSKLNWIAGSEDAGDSEALGYIKSIGFSFNTFEPAYVIKFSDAAIAKGLQEPDASGATEHYKAGLHVYAGFDGLLAAKLWAENGGNKYYGEADVWGENGNADYDYFAMATNSSWDTTGANFNIDNIRNDLTIKVYFCENDVTSAVGEVNYNLAAYINSMLKDAEGNAAYIEAAKAIYAYSYVSAVYNAN